MSKTKNSKKSDEIFSREDYYDDDVDSYEDGMTGYLDDDDDFNEEAPYPHIPIYPPFHSLRDYGGPYYDDYDDYDDYYDDLDGLDNFDIY